MPRLIGTTHRYEMTDQGHSKFWEYKPQGSSFIASWGKIGKDAQGTKVYTEDEIAKLVKEKTKKGYKPV